MSVDQQDRFRELYQNTIDLVVSKDPYSLSDYDELLTLINDQVDLLKSIEVKMERDIEKQDQVISKTKSETVDSLARATSKHEEAYEVLSHLESLMQQSQRTIQISDKLRQLEQEKKNCQDGIRYA